MIENATPNERQKNKRNETYDHHGVNTSKRKVTMNEAEAQQRDGEPTQVMTFMETVMMNDSQKKECTNGTTTMLQTNQTIKIFLERRKSSRKVATKPLLALKEAKVKQVAKILTTIKLSTANKKTLMKKASNASNA